MRQLSALADFHPSLIGSLSVNGVTACGAPIDSLGFREVLMIVMANAVVGSNPGQVQFALQESASLTGTSTAWSTIGNGQISGTMTLTIALASGTSPVISMAKLGERCMDGIRQRYFRILATNQGTSGLGVRIAAGVLLDRPQDTIYVANALTQSTGTDSWNLAI